MQGRCLSRFSVRHLFRCPAFLANATFAHSISRHLRTSKRRQVEQMAVRRSQELESNNSRWMMNEPAGHKFSVFVVFCTSKRVTSIDSMKSQKIFQFQWESFNWTILVSYARKIRKIKANKFNWHFLKKIALIIVTLRAITTCARIWLSWPSNFITKKKKMKQTNKTRITIIIQSVRLGWATWTIRWWLSTIRRKWLAFTACILWMTQSCHKFNLATQIGWSAEIKKVNAIIANSETFMRFYWTFSQVGCTFC